MKITAAPRGRAVDKVEEALLRPVIRLKLLKTEAEVTKENWAEDNYELTRNPKRKVYLKRKLL